MSSYGFDRYSMANRGNKRHKNKLPVGVQFTEAPSPVRRIKPPKRKEPAELCTIATIMLRRNRDILTPEGLHYLSRSQERELTEKESKKALALIAWLKGGK